MEKATIFNMVEGQYMTFDEWFEKKHGLTFKEMHEFTGNTYDAYLRALTKELRDYVSDMVNEKLS